eukprot:gene25316-30570_t
MKFYGMEPIWSLLAALLLQGSVSWSYVLPTKVTGLRRLATSANFEIQRPPSEIASFIDLILSSLDGKDPSFSSLKFKDNDLLVKSSLDRSGVEVTKHIKCKIVEIKKWKSLALQVQYSHTTNDQVKNFRFNEVKDEIYDIIHQYGFSKATLLLLDGQQHTLTMKREKVSNNIVACSIATMRNNPPSAATLVNYDHDRSKSYLVPATQPFLQVLNITYLDKKTNSFKVRAEAMDKFVQINKFTETIGALLQKYEGLGDVEVVDVGCGKGYLTFAVHDYLQGRVASIKTTGIEVRPSLVRELNRIVSSKKMEALSFVQGSIGDFVSPLDANAPLFCKPNSAKVLVALHACDTATDDAIFLGIQSNADVMVLSPCCQKQLREQLDKLAAKPSEHLRSTGLDAMLKFGILRERSTEMVTDTIRALCLQLAGYEVKVFEFIDATHTAKNVMLTAVKRDKPVGEGARTDLLNQLTNLVATFGISQHQLLQHMQLQTPQLPTVRSNRQV